MRENRELQRQARERLRGKWALSLGCSLFYFLITGAAGSTRAGIISLVLGGPATLGTCFVFLSIARGKDPPFGDVFEGFRRFFDALLAYLVVTVLVVLWTLLLVIPGIIAALSYSMTFFVLADEPATGALEAWKKSRDMMRGNRWKLFCLFCRFIGWAFLSLLTMGVGFLWLFPYVQTSLACFYDDVRPIQSG